MRKSVEIKNESLRLNLIFNIIYQVIVVLSPLIITPKLARIFGAEYLGIRSFTFSIVYYFAVFGVLGLDMFGQRQIAIEKNDFERRSKTFWTIFTTRFILMFISTSLFVAYFMLFSSSEFERFVYICWLLYLIREMINPIWFLQGIEKYRILSILNIFSQIVYVAFTFIFINSKELLPLYVVFYAGIPLAISLCYFPIVFKYVKYVKPQKQEMIKSIKSSLVYFVPTIATAIYSMIDKTMLGFFDVTKVSTGLYESAEKLVKVALAFSTASFTIIRTKMSNLYSKNDKPVYDRYCELFISVSMLLCWPIMFGIIGISKDFVPVFFGDGFDEVVGLSYIFSAVIPCLTISGLLQAIYIFPYGLQKTMDLYYVVIVLINIALNGVLIYFFDAVGAIIASITAELILATILLIKARKEIRIKKIFVSSIKYIISAGVMLTVMLLLSAYIDIPMIWKVVLEFFVGVIVYFATNYLLLDRFLIEQTKNIFNKIINIIKYIKNKNNNADELDKEKKKRL